MLKDKIKPRKPVQIRDSKKSNDRTLPSDIFQLISLIPKKVKSVLPFSRYEANLKFAEALLIFCESKLSSKLNELNFSKSSTLGEFIYSLSELITENKFTIVYALEGFENSGVVDFFFFNFKYEWHWYVMEAKALSDIASPQLKTGYAHLMKRFGEQTEHSFVAHSYSNFEDSLYEEQSCFRQSDFEDGCYNAGFETFEEYEVEILKPYKQLKDHYNECVSKPISYFKSYLPSNEKEKELMDLISHGLTIDFSIIHRFPDDQNCFTDDEDLVSYTESFMLLYDYVSELDEQLMEFKNERANNVGVTTPTNYFRYMDGQILNGPSKDEEEELQKLCDFLCNLSNFFDDGNDLY